MNYAQAVKEVTSSKLKPNLMVIELAYNMKVVLPYKDAMTLIAALENAEEYQDPYSGVHSIQSFDRTKLQIKIMPHSEYTDIKVAALLGLTMKELQESRKPPTES